MTEDHRARMIVAPGEKYDGDIMCHYSPTLVLYHLHRTPLKVGDPPRKVYYETHHHALDATAENTDGTTNTYRVWAADDVTSLDMLNTISNADPDKLRAVENTP